MPSAPTKILIALMLAVGGWIPTNARAMPRLVRQLDGEVRAVDRNSRTLTVQAGQQAKPLEFVWDRDTRFIQNLQFTNATALKRGATVKIHYRWPLFGKKFATRIVWQDRRALPLDAKTRSAPQSGRQRRVEGFGRARRIT